MDLIKTRPVFTIFAFRTCFTTCIGITWTFLSLLADTRIRLSSSAIGLVVMINVLISGLLQAPMGYAADRFSKKSLTLFGGFLALGAMLCLDHAGSFTQLMVINGVLGLAGGISLPAIMAMGVIEGRRSNAMGSIMGLLALGHSIGMLAGPLLGLAYGVLSGSCTFGFIAPILAIVTVQEKVLTGVLFILLFAVGHSLPIVVAGSSTAAVKRVMESSRWQGAGNWFRKGAGVLIGVLGLYFMVTPSLSI